MFLRHRRSSEKAHQQPFIIQGQIHGVLRIQGILGVRVPLLGRPPHIGKRAINVHVLAKAQRLVVKAHIPLGMAFVLATHGQRK